MGQQAKRSIFMAASTPQHPIFPSQGCVCWQSPVNLEWGETFALQQGCFPTNPYDFGSCSFCCLSISRKAGGWLFSFTFKFHKGKENMDGRILDYINHLVWKFPSWNILSTLWKTEIFLVWVFFWAKAKTVVSQSSRWFVMGGNIFCLFSLK